MANKNKKEIIKGAPPKKKTTIEFNGNVQQYVDLKTPLMPGLEELVKKDSNRLIGCGG